MNRGLAVKGAWILGGRLFSRGSQVVIFVILARALDVEQFGIFGVITSSVGIAVVLGSLGQRQAVAFEIGNGRVSLASAKMLSWILPIPLGAAAGAVVACIYGDTLGIDVGVAVGLLITVVVLSIAHTISQSVQLGLGNMREFAAGDAMPRLVLLALIAGALVVDMLSLVSALLLYGLSYGIGFVYNRWRAPQDADGRSQRLHWRHMLLYGGGFALNLALVSLSSRAVLFIVQAQLGDIDAGVYFAAMRVAEMFLELATSLGLAWFSLSLGSASEDTLRDGLTAAWKMAVGFSVVAAAVVFAAPIVIEVLVGGAYAGAVDPLRWLCLAMPFAAASKMLYPSLAASGSPWKGTLPLILCCIFTIVLAQLFVPVWGLAGAAVAFSAGQIVLVFCYAVVIGRILILERSRSQP